MNQNILIPLCLIVGVTTLSLSGQVQQNRVLRLSSDGDFIEIADDNSLDLSDSLTVEAWIKAEFISPDMPQRVLSKNRPGGGTGLHFGLFTGGIPALGLNDGADVNLALRSPDPVKVGQWYHLAGTYDGAVAKLFVNGFLRNSADVDMRLQDSAMPLLIGREVYQGTVIRTFLGDIDEVRVWNRAIPQAEIRAGMYKCLVGDESGLVGYWNFDDGTARDISPEMNDGILQGSASTPNIILPAIADSDSDGLSDGFETGLGRYLTVPGSFTWDEARIDAESRGGHLATIIGEAEWQAIVQNAPGVISSDQWLGGSEPDEGFWTWITGEPWSYTRWGTGEPNDGNAEVSEDFVATQNGDKWNDATASARLPYLFEIGFFTDPSQADTDSDGLNDGDEYLIYNTIPTNADSDGDGVNDGDEISNGTDPLTPDPVEEFDLLVESRGGGTISVSPMGGPYASGTKAILTAIPDNGWLLMEWRGDVSRTDNPLTLTVDSDKEIQAVFGTSLRTVISGPGNVSVEPSLNLVPYATTLRVTAIPDSGNYFFIWGGSTTSRFSPLEIQVTEPNPVISALFEPLEAGQAALVVHVDGGGTVTANPSRNVFNVGDPVVLNAHPSDPDEFLGWSGDAESSDPELTLVMDSTKVVRAKFGSGLRFVAVDEAGIIGPPSSRGVVWGDFSGDGWDDVLLVGEMSRDSRLYYNNGTSSFTPLQGLFNSIEASVLAGGAAAADANNDGLLDFFLGSLGDGGQALYLNNGEGFDRTVVSETGSISAAAWGDYNRDGELDLFLANQSGANQLFRGRGDGTFDRVTVGSIVSDIASSTACGWTDYNGDGWPDLFVANRDGQNNNLYRNSKDGTFTKITSGPIVNDGGDSRDCEWADYDNDGRSDLFVANHSLGDNFLYRNLGNGSFERVGLIATDAAYSSTGGAWADYDNDGFVDLLISNDGSPSQLFRNVGLGGFEPTDILPTTDGTSMAVAWADINNDGFLDALLAQDTGQLLFRNSGGGGNRFLGVNLVGTISNRSGLGSMVRVKNGEFWMNREIVAGGSTGQSTSVAHFGLGQSQTADVLRIEWPSGTIQEFIDLEADRTLTIHEPPLFAPVEYLDGNKFEMLLTSRGGFSYDIRSTENFADWTSVTVIENVNGPVQVLDENAEQGARFYRAMQIDPQLIHQAVIVTDADPGTLLLDRVSIQQNSISIDGNFLTLTVEHGGGCLDHDFQMFMAPASFEESEPVQADLWLRHDGHGDACLALITQRLTFDLGQVLTLHQRTYGRRDRVQLNVHGMAETEPTDPETIVFEPQR